MDKLKKLLKKHWGFIIFVIMGITAIVIRLVVMNDSEEIKTSNMDEVTYTEFLELCKDGKVDTVYYNTAQEVMSFTLLNDDTLGMTREERNEYEYKLKDYRKTLYPAYDEFRKDMLGYDVNLVVLNTGISFLDVLISIISSLPMVLLLIVLFSMLKTTNRSGQKNLLQTSNITFDNVIGQDEILDDVKFITRMLKEPDLGEKLGVSIPRGILFAGEPGTGKTLIAKAIAGEAGVPFIYASASQFNELFVGMGAKRIRELFSVARKNAPCIIFIDELDAVGGKRDKAGRHSEDDQTINALLTEMDGFTPRDNIFVIAATNRPNELDPALTRAGRFDRQININTPRKWTVRKEMFEYYLKGRVLSDDIDLESISKQVTGFTGADISAVCNEAGLVALMNSKECIDMASLEEAIDKRLFKGNRSKGDKNARDIEIVAYHESGHAVMNYLLGHEITRASIQANTSGVGGVVFGADKDSQFTTDKELRERVMIAYAGRASEELQFGLVTQGASSDITQATNILMAYIEKYGFDKDFGLLDMETLSSKHLIESDTIISKLSEMSKNLYSQTKELLGKNMNLVKVLADELLEYETLSGAEISKLLEREK